MRYLNKVPSWSLKSFYGSHELFGMSKSVFEASVSVERLGKLCYLRPKEEESERIREDVRRILVWMNLIGQCDAKGMTPLVNPVDRYKSLGMVEDSLLGGPAPKEDVLRNAPHSEMGYFIVQCSDKSEE